MGHQGIAKAVIENAQVRRIVDADSDWPGYSEILAELAETPDAYEEILAYAAIRGTSGFRALALKSAAENLHLDAARDYIAWLTHDPEDWIAFRAIRLSGEKCLQSSAHDLFSIIGALSTRLQPGVGKPVGVGHALVMDALQSIIGSPDLDDIVKFEDSFFESAERPIAKGEETADTLPSSRMTLIPSTPVRVGLSQSRFPWHFFDHSDTHPEHVVQLPDYFIDRTPVTAAEYDDFCSNIIATGHATCHPDEAPDKDHRRNTGADPRFPSESPVAGVDWFDAYGYASWAGKRLPNEIEWEVAASGVDDTVFPWGEEFDQKVCACAYTCFDTPIRSVAEWRKLLTTASEYNPSVTVERTCAADQSNRFGLRGMTGGVWEWTSTSFSTRENLQPRTLGRSSSELAYDVQSLAVIKGGAWSSIADLLVPAYRGKDLIVDRHNEIGFRCARDASQVAM